MAGITSLWELTVTATGQEAWFYNDLAKQYGHLIRISPNAIITDDPDVLRRISGARGTYTKDTFYSASFKLPGYDTMFSTTDTPTHDAIKAKLAGSYGGRETLAMEPIVDEIVKALEQHIRDKTARGPGRTHVVNFARVVNYYTLDVITRVAFGRELGFLKTDSDVFGLLSAARTAIKKYTIPMSIPWLRSITTSTYFLRLFGPKSTDESGAGLMIRILEETIKKRYEPGAPDEKDLLGGFIRNGLTLEPCISEAMFAMSAGADTVASTMRSTMLYLITTPRVYYKLKQVVRQCVNEGGVSSPIRTEEAKTISYIQAVIYEGLRMRPPVPLKFPKVVPPQGDEIDGKFIPGGTAVGWNLLPMMRHPRHWGHDGDVFRPERFTEADENTRASMERLVDMVFGHGRFGCAGRPLAFMELNKVYFELFRHFDFQLVNPQHPWNSEIWSVWMDDDFLVQITESPVERDDLGPSNGSASASALED
ncbi:hypothetical protein diail_11706 [Diaporthe ilicicola]|nr:hypothetical protein diail_11706 [Diaporthe ilicicola]